MAEPVNDPEADDVASLNAPELDVDELDEVAGGLLQGSCDMLCGLLYSCETNM